MNAKNWKQFCDEPSLFVAEPNVKATNSWKTLEDVPDEEKAILLFFEALAQAKLYMTIVRKNNCSYAKLYIVQYGHVNILYVKSDAVCQGERYHRNRQGN